jgi:glycosyltransferase involved in cell wall biosynthesis
MTKLSKKEVIVLAGAWPGISSGARIAVSSVLTLSYDCFDRAHFISVSDSDVDEDAKRTLLDEWFHIPIKRPHLWRRFLKSVLSTEPASIVRFRPAKRQVLRRIDNILNFATGRVFVIIEDSPLAFLLPDLQKRYNNIPTAIRTYDVLSKAFEDMRLIGPLVNRLAWRYELAKLRIYEKRILVRPTKHWTITQQDGRIFQQRLSIPSHGVLDVCMDVVRYKEVESDNLNTIVQVGTDGIRKWTGMVQFIDLAWPMIRSEVPSARLLVAGRNSERLTNSTNNIEGLGYVQDDREALRKGQIVINSQFSGSGLQLKSIVAMLAGKTLVSTQMGLDGVAGTNGKEFIAANSYEEMAQHIISLLKDPGRALKIGLAARKKASNFYNREVFYERARPLIYSFIESGKRV